MSSDLLSRKATHFVLWSPNTVTTKPRLVIGTFQPGNPPTLAGETQFPLTEAAGVTDLWEIAASACGLTDGTVYHYWFQVNSTHPDSDGKPILCTDPTAWTVDWRLIPPPLKSPFTDDDRQPASVVLFDTGKLLPADPGGERLTSLSAPTLDTLLPNNRLVIYELPTAWSRAVPGSAGVGTGTFQDVRSLVDQAATGKNFSDLLITGPGKAYLVDLGINALELLPPADSFFKREWGYDTAHYLAPDSDLGQPYGFSWPTSNRDLSDLVLACQKEGIRFFVDVVMAFARNEPYQYIAFDPFYIADPKDNLTDPDALTSRSTPGHPDVRNAFGSTLFRYTKPLAALSYDPVSGKDVAGLVPARQHMFTQLERWMTDFGVGGLRLDSIENVANWDFIGGFKNLARGLWSARWKAQGLPGDGSDHFLVVGEELTDPKELLTQGRLDGLWNDNFHAFVRPAVFGQNAAGQNEPSFEWTVRKAIDCRILGFTDGTQAVNYITSHDVEGEGRERLFTSFTKYSGFSAADAIRRIKLAFSCLFTAVGVPMILAGDEFADLHTRFDVHGNVTQDGGKQVSPVHFDLLNDVADPKDNPDQQALVVLRRDLLQYVSRLIHARTSVLALSVNDTDFIHVDFNEGKRVLAWKRGPGPDGSLVVVVANFSDFSSVAANQTEYVINNWPAGHAWTEITQDRKIPAEFAGRETIFQWEAKVYVSS